MMFSNLQGEFDTSGRIRRCVIEAGAASLVLRSWCLLFLSEDLKLKSEGGQKEHIVQVWFFFCVFEVQP